MPLDDINTRRDPSDATFYNALGRCVNALNGPFVARRLELENTLPGESDAHWLSLDASGNVVINVPSGKSIRAYVDGVDTGALGGGGGGVDLATATGVLDITKGGTNATSAAAARTNLGCAAAAARCPTPQRRSKDGPTHTAAFGCRTGTS